jgi:hypothetical protein
VGSLVVRPIWAPDNSACGHDINAPRTRSVWVVNLGSRGKKVLRAAEQEPVVLPPVKARRAA